MTLDKRQTIGLVGAFVMLIGFFVPIIHVPIVGYVTILTGHNQEGYFSLGFTLGSFGAVLLEEYLILLVLNCLSLSILSYTAYRFYTVFSDAYEHATSIRSGSIFGVIEQQMLNSFQIQFGWVLLIGGCLILVFCALKPHNREKSKIQQSGPFANNPPQLPHNGNNPKK